MLMHLISDLILIKLFKYTVNEIFHTIGILFILKLIFAGMSKRWGLVTYEEGTWGILLVAFHANDIRLNALKFSWIHLNLSNFQMLFINYENHRQSVKFAKKQKQSSGRVKNAKDKKRPTDRLNKTNKPNNERERDCCKSHCGNKSSVRIMQSFAMCLEHSGAVKSNILL